MKRLLFVALVIFCGCYTAPRSLQDLCVVQEQVLTRYVEVADKAIQADAEISAEDKAAWTTVAKKLIRNQGTINKFVKGVEK